MRLKLCPGPSTCPEPKEKVKSESSCDHLLCKDTGLESMGSLELSDTYLSFLPLWQAFFEAQTLSAMGLLKVGTPLHWKDSLEHCNYVREHGILQFIATYRRLKHLENDRLFYGDEIEYSMLKVRLVI